MERFTKLCEGYTLYAPFADALYAFKSRGFGGEIAVGVCAGNESHFGNFPADKPQSKAFTLRKRTEQKA